MALELELDSTVQVVQGPFSTVVDGELIVFDPNAGYYFGSGTVGAKIWELASQKTSVRRIVETIVDEFEVDFETCEHDVKEFISALLEKSLIIVL